MSSYWNHEFKHGSPPTITSPALFWWHRHTPIASHPTNDPLGKDDSCDSLTDTIYAVVFMPEGSPAAQLVITSASLVAVSLSSGVHRTASNLRRWRCSRSAVGQTWLTTSAHRHAAGGKATDAQTVQPGVNLISTPFVVGETGIVSRFALDVRVEKAELTLASCSPAVAPRCRRQCADLGQGCPNRREHGDFRRELFHLRRARGRPPLVRVVPAASLSLSAPTTHPTPAQHIPRPRPRRFFAVQGKLVTDWHGRHPDVQAGLDSGGSLRGSGCFTCRGVDERVHVGRVGHGRSVREYLVALVGRPAPRRGLCARRGCSLAPLPAAGVDPLRRDAALVVVNILVVRLVADLVVIVRRPEQHRR